ncbi:MULTISPECIES: M56 family metallopeptidase [Acidobacteriaceae]|uniref:M56 family metallopeptidase n=1 Tax=Acidobacteriaceae TaxID=204434 RepID=UPI00131AAC19|nr:MULTISPECIES: M56 family metallopeptidase [Acidobacteriaceae]MDW5264856.1 M56 family metallopeptidase [Edaphobacter sp.]
MSGLEAFVLGYLVNSLWQVPLVCLAGYGCARLVRRMGPQAEHRVWVAALMIAAILPACVGAVFGMPRIFGGAGVGAGATAVQVEMGRFTQVGGASLYLPLWLRHGATMLYLGFALFLCGRLAWGLIQSNGLRRGSRRLSLTGELAAVWKRYCRSFDVPDAEIASTPMVAGPLTLGLRRRVLLVPPEFMEKAEASDVEAVLGHELAHMRRRDYAKNVLYELVSLPVSYHPMTRWLKAQIRQSRELVCDAMAAEFVTTREHYARSLLRLASLMSSQTQTMNIHAIGIFDANILERRVMSLMTKPKETRGLLRIGVAAVCVVVGVATCGSALALRLDVNEPPPASAMMAAAPNHPVKVQGAIMAGSRLGGQNPVYPAKARADKNTVDGTCTLRAIINKDGRITRVRVVKSLRKDYDQSALTAVKTWKYKPYLLNGEPVAVETTININFNIEG